jgi:hypothetical protein
MKRVHNCSPSPPQSTVKKVLRGKNKRKNRLRAPLRSSSVIEKLHHGSQKVISELQAMQDLSDPKVITEKIKEAA